MKLAFLLLFIFAMGSHSEMRAQTTVEKHLFKVNVLAPGLSYETRLFNKLTLHTEAGYTITSFSIGNTGGDSDSDLNANFFFSAGMRQYYNFAKREAKNKNVAGNSGNFIGLRVLAYSNDMTGSGAKYLLPGLVWGLQRTYASRWNLGCELGVGYQVQSNNNTPTLIISSRLGNRIIK
jgi:hypothetical protein